MPGEADAAERERITTACPAVQRIAGEWVVSTPKTRAGVRTITLPKEATNALRRQAEWRLKQGAGRDLVFTGAGGERLSPDTVWPALRRECARLGLPAVSPHGLRHPHASLLLAEGLPIPEVSKRLGDANPGITMSVCAHTMYQDDGAAAVAAISRLFETFRRLLGATGAGKALNLMAPAFFPLWDDCITQQHLGNPGQAGTLRSTSSSCTLPASSTLRCRYHICTGRTF